MGLFDNLDDAARKAKELAAEHSDKVEDGIDKVADLVDDKTGHKHSDKIDKGVEAARKALGNLDKDTPPR